MKQIIFKCILLYVTLCYSSSIFAERFNSLNEDYGLSSRRCFSVKQDKNGFIWIATKLSIDRYDGQQFVHYKLNSPNGERIEAINSNFICLAPDSSIWAFNHSGNIYKYNSETDSFQFVYSIQSYYHKPTVINNLFFENNDLVHIATLRGVLRLDIKKKKVYSYSVVNNMNVNHITKVGEYFYLSTQNGLLVVRFTDEKTIKIVNHFFKNQFVTLVYYDKKYQQFWIGTFSNGIYILSARSNSLPFHVLSNVVKPIRAIIPYNKNTFAVGVDGEGVLLVDRKTRDISYVFNHNESNQYSLSSNSVYDLLLDKQNTLWIAMYHSGVSYLDNSYLKFQNFTHIRGDHNSISNSYVNMVYEDSDGDIWFGTSDGLSLLNRKTNKWKHYFQEPDYSNKNVILALCENPTGNIWAGGYAFGLAEINKKKGTIKRYKSQSKKTVIATDNIYSLYSDKYTGNIWTGGIYGKITSFNPKNTDTKFFSENSMRCFSSYNDSTIILGSSGGLILMNKNNGERTYTRLKKSVNSILQEKDKTYWIGTMGNGLYYYNLATDSLLNYNQEVGLSSNHIYAIEKDGTGNLWLSTENGLNMFNPLTHQVTRFTKKDGLISNQFLPNSSFNCSTGELLFGSADGAIIFNPEDIKKDNLGFIYPLTFTELALFGEPVNASTENSPLKKSINETSKIILPYNKNYLSLTFTLPNYQSSYKIEYSYFLKGYDLGWTKFSIFNKAVYSKLSPGKYEFKVRAFVERKLLEERNIIIVINEPWWNTIWAWITYILVFTGIAYEAIKYVSNSQKRKQTEEKIDFFINTAHDILTPLNLIEAPLKEISDKGNFSTDIQYFLSLALNNVQKLSHFIHQLIDFQKIILNAEHLAVRQNNLKEFFSSKKYNYQTLASQKFISLNFHNHEINDNVLIDKEKVNRIIDILLSNAIKYTPYGGTIDVRLISSENNWGFTIRDTGLGISKREQNMIFKHIFRADNDINSQNVGSGIGLKMAYALVKIHQGKISFTSNEGIGSEFIVTLPRKYSDEFISTSPEAIIVPDITDTVIQSHNRANIFIVESNPEISVYLQKTLSRNYNVSIFSDTSKTLSKLSSFSPDLIITGSFVSDVSCLDFCLKIRENNKTSHIPLFVILNSTNTEIN